MGHPYLAPKFDGHPSDLLPVDKSSSVTLIFLYNNKRANSAAYRPPVERIPGYLPSAGHAALNRAGAAPAVDTEGVAVEGNLPPTPGNIPMSL
jgi:hypothetical protein